MTMIAVRPEDQARAVMPEPRKGRARPAFLSAEVLDRAKERGERRLMVRMEQMRG